MKNNNKIKLEGIYTALVTPMNNKKQIDYKSLKNLIDQQLNAKVNGIVILGTTGEAPTIDYYEKYKLINFVQTLTKNKTQLIIGAGSNDTSKTISEVQGLSSTSADAILLSTPAYNKPTETGLYEHFKAIADASKKPIILYNVPSRTGISIPISVIEKLSKHPNIIGLKDASTDISYSLQLSKFGSDKFVLLSGNDNITLPLTSLGYKGVISVLSNALPYEMKYFYELIKKGDKQTALILQNYLLPLMNICFVETNPIAIKYILSKLGLIKNNLRPPLTKLSVNHQLTINKLLKNYGLI